MEEYVLHVKTSHFYKYGPQFFKDSGQDLQ